MTKKLTSTRKFLAAICIILGIIGLVLPFLQGIFFLILGISILGFDTLRDEVNWVKNKIDLFHSKKQTSYTLQLYLIPLEWLLLLEQKKVKKVVKDVKEKIKNE